MPGTPKWHELERQVEIAGGWESVTDAIADGATLRLLAAKFKVSRGWFWRVLCSDPERKKRYQEALVERSEAMVEEAVEIVDNADDQSPAGVQKAKLRAELRQWLAAVDNARYRRANAQASVQVNIGQLHLDALRWRPTVAIDSAPTRALPAEIVVESTEPGDTP